MVDPGMTGLLAAAFGAGMVSTVNPCGFAMLPAYLGLFLGERSKKSALLVGAAVSAGFVAVYLVAGLLVASGVRAVVTWIPWLAAVVGVGLVALGIAELRGHHVLARMPGVKRAPKDGSVRGLVGFGVSYGVASLSCTLPIFLSLTAAAVAGGSLFQSFSVFLAYGAGMSLVVMSLTLFLAVGRDRVVRAIRPIAAHLSTISGWILILAGGFIVFYWATVLSAGGEAIANNPVARFFESIAARAAQTVSAFPLQTALVVLGIALAAWWILSRDKDSEPEPADGEPAEMTADN